MQNGNIWSTQHCEHASFALVRNNDKQYKGLPACILGVFHVQLLVVFHPNSAVD